METRENMKEVLDLLRLITMGTKPMIAAVEGDAFGAGCSIAIACDVVVATPTSRFGTSFGKIGLVPDMGMLYTLVQRIGRPRAARMMMLATTASGAEAVTRSEEHTSELQSLMRNSYAVLFLKKKKTK